MVLRLFEVSVDRQNISNNRDFETSYFNIYKAPAIPFRVRSIRRDNNIYYICSYCSLKKISTKKRNIKYIYNVYFSPLKPNAYFYLVTNTAFKKTVTLLHTVNTNIPVCVLFELWLWSHRKRNFPWRRFYITMFLLETNYEKVKTIIYRILH